MPITVLMLIVLSLSPITWTSWTNWFSDQVRVVITPIAHPITIAIDTIIPPTISDPNASIRERELIDELNRARTQLLQTRNENNRLNELMEQFSRGAQITPDLDVRQIHRPRVSTISKDQILIKVNNDDQITQGTVAVANAVQLVGRTSRLSGRTASVLLITADSSQPILATILLNKSGSKQAKCLLEPVGDGTLKGEVARGTLDESLNIEIGQEVRLLDTQWPAHAQMLMIGTIEEIKPNLDQPLRQLIIVRPTIKDLRTIPEVIFRLPHTSDQDSTNSSIGGAP